ncbi:MAG: oxygen-independent coproporphyrinogen III oxidase [Cytophagales bacterium]
MNTSNENLIQKYNIPTPRYTSYPTVPFWDKESFTPQKYIDLLAYKFENESDKNELSLYIHLPYCESLCTYCGCNTRITVNHSVEIPYINAILKEWDLYLQIFKTKPLIKDIHLGGGTPTFFSAHNLEKLINGILSKSIITENPQFSFEGHPANTTKEHLSTLYNLGFRRVSFGIQDFDEKIQEVINRKQSVEQVEYVTQIAREIGYTSINYDLVYGLPLQNIKTVNETIQTIIKLKPDRIAYYSYAHIPWLKPGQRKFTELDLPDNETKRNLYDLGRKIFEQNGYVEIGMDHFALKTDSLYKSMINNSLHRNFMGYTDCNTNTLIGLGCSSISDIGSAYAQNLKTVEAYLDSVNSGKLPVFTGHIQSEEDIYIKNHITELICKLKTELSYEAKYKEISEVILYDLKEMLDEKLVEIDKNIIYVTSKGKTFIRNICSKLDLKLKTKELKENTFSKSI